VNDLLGVEGVVVGFKTKASGQVAQGRVAGGANRVQQVDAVTAGGVDQVLHQYRSQAQAFPGSGYGQRAFALVLTHGGITTGADCAQTAIFVDQRYAALALASVVLLPE
jgi:hypothetical protein